MRWVIQRGSCACMNFCNVHGCLRCLLLSVNACIYEGRQRIAFIRSTSVLTEDTASSELL